MMKLKTKPGFSRPFLYFQQCLDLYALPLALVSWDKERGSVAWRGVAVVLPCFSRVLSSRRDSFHRRTSQTLPPARSLDQTRREKLRVNALTTPHSSVFLFFVFLFDSVFVCIAPLPPCHYVCRHRFSSVLATGVNV